MLCEGEHGNRYLAGYFCEHVELLVKELSRKDMIAWILVYGMYIKTLIVYCSEQNMFIN